MTLTLTSDPLMPLPLPPVQRETWTLLHHDSIKYPQLPSGLDGKKALKAASKASSIPVPEIHTFSLQELKAASQLLESEVLEVKKAMGHESLPLDDYLMAMQGAEAKANEASGVDSKQRIERYKAELEGIRREMEKDAKRASKLEGKVNILVGGLQQRDAALAGRLRGVQESLQGALIELRCFEALQEREQRVAPERIERILELVSDQRKREQDLQVRYKALTREKDELIKVGRAANGQVKV